MSEDSVSTVIVFPANVFTKICIIVEEGLHHRPLSDVP